MSAVVWVVSCPVSEPPELVRRCPSCGPVAHLPTGRFRVNASGRRLDVWLLYRCAGCDRPWKRPVHERISVDALPPALLAQYEANDAARVLAVASVGAGVVPPDVVVDGPRWDGVSRVILRVPTPVAARLDRVVAVGLGVPRSQVRALIETTARWSRPPVDGTALGARRIRLTG
ncbi:MAG: DUF1062 domain-containing protein [Myxococcota bacterium]